MMNIQSTTGNYFRTAVQVGVRQKVARRRPLDLPGGLQLWQAVGKVMLWGVPLVLSLNLLCSSLSNSYRSEITVMQQAIHQEEKQMEQLLQQRTRLTSPVRVKIAAAAKLDLFEPEKNQIKRM
jgi:ABC-type thiamine transport system ATPase subunit